MNYRRAFFVSGGILLAGTVLGFAVWVLFTSIIAFGHYDSSYFLMPVREWCGFFRVAMFIYGLIVLFISVLAFIEEK